MTSAHSPAPTVRNGLLLGALGISGFALTLPATRLAVAHLDPLLVGLGRSLLAALPAALLLAVTRQRRPTRDEWKGLAVVAGGLAVGFPLFSALAMVSTPAAHGGVVLGMLPLATALLAALLGRERPAPLFWWATVLGSVLVVGYSVARGDGRLHSGDLALLGATLAAAVGYLEGARLTATLGGWQTISWALVLAAPFVAVPVIHVAAHSHLHAPAAAWVAFGYVTLVSQFLAIFPWLRGLALGGVARVSQLMLLQPFLTLLAAALLLNEWIDGLTVLTALLVGASVWVAKRAPIERHGLIAPARPGP